MLMKTEDSRKVFTPEIRANQNGLSLSVVVPTRNESGNVEKLLTSLSNAFSGMSIEVIFVDDSIDDTPQVVEAAVGRFPAQHVRMIHRSPEERADGLGWGSGHWLKGCPGRLCLRDGWRHAASAGDGAGSIENCH